MTTTTTAARARSFWAWGFEDAFPSDEERQGLASAVAALLGIAARPVPPLPQLDVQKVPPPRLLPPPALAGFASAEPADRARHTYGKSFCDQLRALHGDFQPAPDFVLRPADEAEVALALRECAAAELAVIPYGGGTSVVGGVEAQRGPGQRGACCLDLSRLDRVLEVDPVSRAARVQAGATGPGLEQQLLPHGLTLRHYPQSFELSTVGGWLATRAGGHFATLYTHIDELVESVRLITPRGSVETRRLPASGAGPQPERLFLGSEGTLGVFTEAWLRLQVRPRFRSSASVEFATLEQAAQAAQAVAQAGLYPSNCRLLDSGEAMLAGAATTPVLLLAFESAGHSVEPWLERALALCTAHAGRCPKGPVHRREGERGADATAESWRRAFFAGPYRQSALCSLGIMADTFETACTWSRFPELHARVRGAVEETLQRVCGAGMCTLRFSHVYPDGPAPYFTFVGPLDPERGLEGALGRWQAVKEAASAAIADSGGTITHHHAVGRTHRAYYDRERPPLFARALASVKSELDPAWILNPGVLLDRPGSQS